MAGAGAEATTAREVGGWKAVLRRFGTLDLLDNRFPALHGLRVFAIISVIQFHVTWIFNMEEKVYLDPEFVGSSVSVFFGMDLFFMLSGFLIGSILLHSLQTDGSQRIKRFYLRRAFRTFPSYYIVLTGLSLFFLATGTLTAMQRKHLPIEYIYGTNFLTLSMDNVVMLWGWSLALEEQFYLTVPLLFVVLQRLKSDRARVVFLVSLWSVAFFVRLGVYLRHREWGVLDLHHALYFRTYSRFDTLVAGVLLAFVHQRWKVPITAWLKDPLHRAMIAVPSFACLWPLMRPGLFGDEHASLVHIFRWGTLTTTMYFGWLILLLHGDGLITRALSAPIFRRIATLGYGVYLVHMPLCRGLFVPLARKLISHHVSLGVIWPMSLVALTLLSLAIGYVMHIFIEKPSLTLREWLAA